MNKKTTRRNIETPQINKISNGLNKIEQTITFEQALCGDKNCICLICQSKNQIKKKTKELFFNEGSQNSDKWLMKVLTGLSSQDALSIKIFIPDISFTEGDTLRVFYTDIKDNRIKKMDGTVPSKNVYYTMLKLKKLYKQMLEQNFHKAILNQINPQFVHEKYMQQILPSYFNDGEDSDRLHKNKTKFMKYVFHKDQKFLIQSIQQHKINQNQPFCSIRFQDGNMQLFSKRQFQTYSLMKLSPDVVFVQSYIKQKQQEKSHFTSCYSFLSKETDLHLFNRAEKEILILIGGIGKHSESYEDIENYEDATIQLMKQDIEKYIQYMTYKIVHYLAMVARIYIKHIKINWILNDLHMVYMQNIFEFQTTQISLRTLKYRLPPKQQNLVFYKDSQNFLNLYKQLQVFRETKRMSIRRKIIQQKQKQQSQRDSIHSAQKSASLEPSQSQITKKLQPLKKHIPKFASISKTISTAAHNSMSKDNPRLMAKTNVMQDRYYFNKESKEKQVRLTQLERSRKRRFMSVLEKYNV